jgi:hypothetical protein
MAAAALPIVSGLGSLFGGILGSNASKKAAQEQIQADQKGIGTIQGSETSALGQLSPYTSAGSKATGTLSDMLSTPGQGLLTPWTQQFTAPTADQAAATPGYQFQLKAGEDALQNSAAARGGLLSGRTLADMNTYAQGLAGTNYQNTFNNALTQYQSAYNTFQNNQANTYSRLFGVSGQGLNAANSAAGINMGAGQDIASLQAAQGRAAAGGTLGSANAWSGAIGGIGSSLAQLPWGKLSNMNPGNPGANTYD